MKIYTTSDWIARKPRKLPDLTDPVFIVIHHTGTKLSSNGSLEGGKKLARAIQNYHMDKNGWDDSGHNFLNTTRGIILEGRHGTLEAIEEGKCVLSAHSGNLEANRSPGIENEGIYTTEKMPDEQWQSLVELTVYLCKNLNIDPSNIRGHRDFKSTECPGEWLYAQLPRLIDDVNKRLL